LSGDLILRFQVTSQKNRGCNTIDDSFAFFPTDISGDQQLFRRFGGHPFVPPDDRHRQGRFQFHGKLAHRSDGRPFPSVQLKRQPQHHSFHIVRSDQRGDVGDIPIQRPPLEGFERLRRPT
jgi:hypothetical protein